MRPALPQLKITRPRRLIAGSAIASLLVSVFVGLSPVGPEPSAEAAGRDPDATWAGNAANPYGGVDYYVDATTGNDTQAGTAIGTAWKTLAKVNATTFAAGDRILLKAGETWNDQQLWPKGSGAAGRPITIDAYGDQAEGLPYIATNGRVNYPITNGVKDPLKVGLTGAVVLRNQQYVDIKNLELSNDDDFATDITTGQFVRDGVSVSINADLLPAGADTIMRGIRVTNLHVHNIDGPSRWQRIHYAGINFQVFGSKQWTQYGKGGYHFEDLVIRDNSFDKVELHAIQSAFNWFGDAQGQADSTGKWHEGWEQLWVRDQDFYSRNVYIGHNYAKDTGQGPFQFANTKNLLAEYNEANGWLQRYEQVSAGLYLWAGADSVMRFNEIYDGPANQYDATPWDLEFTNFNVTYEYNYSHDNQGGWMAYMGNSGNSIARYNLSVNDNGVIWKNMLSTNYSPTYVLNNVFVYDGSILNGVHDEILKDRVYFANNIFYNTSKTATTTWAMRSGGLANGVFAHNAYFEASGNYSTGQPKDAGEVHGDPKFVGNPADYVRGGGVDNIRDSAALFKLRDDSPLIDRARYNVRIGTKDFFDQPNFRGAGPDIGIHETALGEVVTDPIDNDPIENIGIDTRVNLATGKPVVANTTHPADNGTRFAAAKLVDNDKTTRWAAADVAPVPTTIDVDFGTATTFDEIYLDEFTDSGTPERIKSFELQRWDSPSSTWQTFTSGTAVGRDRVIKDFGELTSTKLRLSLRGAAGVDFSPTLTELRVFDNVPAGAKPTVTPPRSLHDRNAAMDDSTNNVLTFTVTPDGDRLTQLRYVTTSGAVVGSLDPGDVDSSGAAQGRYVLTDAFYADKDLGTSGIDFEFASGKRIRVQVEIVDTTELEATLAEARQIPPADTDDYRELAEAIDRADAALKAANRTGPGTGNTATSQAIIVERQAELRAAIDAYQPAGPFTVMLVSNQSVATPRDQLRLTVAVNDRTVRGRAELLHNGAVVRSTTLVRGKATWVLGVGAVGRHTFTARVTAQTPPASVTSAPVTVTVEAGVRSSARSSPR